MPFSLFIRLFCLPACLGFPAAFAALHHGDAAFLPYGRVCPFPEERAAFFAELGLELVRDAGADFFGNPARERHVPFAPLRVLRELLPRELEEPVNPLEAELLDFPMLHFENNGV